MKKNNIVISAIIPIYNNFSLMQPLLHSLNAQKNRFFEIIFIDDCSSDDSYKQLKKESNNFKFNFKLLKNIRNSGPGFTRNIGIENCNSEYITFIDADDYITNDFFDNIIDQINESSFDCLIFDYFKKSNSYEKKVDSFPIKDLYLEPLDALALSNGMCWGKVYKKKIIEENNIIFPKLIRSEDLAFVKVYLSKCKKIIYLQKPLYYYFQNAQSIMHNANTLNINNNIKAFNYIKKNVDDSIALEMIFIREYLYLIVQIMVLLNRNNKEIKKFISDCNYIYPNWTKNKYLKYQPKYLNFVLILIKFKFVFLIKMIFKLKK